MLFYVLLCLTVMLYGSCFVSWCYVCFGVVLRRGALVYMLVSGIGYCHAMLCVVAWRLIVLCGSLCYCVSLFGCSFWASVCCWRVCCFELCLGAAWCFVIRNVGCTLLLCHVAPLCCGLLCGNAGLSRCVVVARTLWRCVASWCVVLSGVVQRSGVCCVLARSFLRCRVVLYGCSLCRGVIVR